MNRWIVKLCSTALIVSILAIGCNDDDDAPNINTTDALVNGGTWKVTYFFDKDKEETSDFAGYTFVFEAGGTFKSVKNGVTTTGTWQVDTSSNKLIINAGTGAKPLEELNDDWVITERSAKLIKLRDDRDDDDGDEYLTFEVI